MTAEEYRKYLEQDFCDVNIDEMTDLLTIKADRNKSLKERRESYLNKVGNWGGCAKMSVRTNYAAPFYYMGFLT